MSPPWTPYQFGELIFSWHWFPWVSSSDSDNKVYPVPEPGEQICPDKYIQPRMASDDHIVFPGFWQKPIPCFCPQKTPHNILVDIFDIPDQVIHERFPGLGMGIYFMLPDSQCSVQEDNALLLQVVKPLSRLSDRE